MDESAVKAVVDRVFPAERERLGVGWWRISFVFGPSELGGRYNADIDRRIAYDRATITLDPSQLDSEQEIIDTLRHELLHLIHAPFDLVDAQLAAVLTPAEYEMLTPVWRFAAEQTVRNLERMFKNLTEPAPETPRRGIPIMNPAKSPARKTKPGGKRGS